MKSQHPIKKILNSLYLLAPFIVKNNNNLLYTIVIYIPQKYDLNYLLGLFGRIFNIHVDIIELALGDIIELR